MTVTFKLLMIGLITALGIVSASLSVSAFSVYGGIDFGVSGGMYGYGYSPYGYVGPSSYQFVPHSFWGHYYNPGLYYSSLDYSLRNNLVRADQQNLGMMYNFISRNSWP